MKKLATTLLLLSLLASAPCALAEKDQRSHKVQHNQAKSQQKAMKKAAKQQHKDLDKAHKRAQHQQ